MTQGLGALLFIVLNKGLFYVAAVKIFLTYVVYNFIHFLCTFVLQTFLFFVLLWRNKIQNCEISQFSYERILFLECFLNVFFQGNYEDKTVQQALSSL